MQRKCLLFALCYLSGPRIYILIKIHEESMDAWNSKEQEPLGSGQSSEKAGPLEALVSLLGFEARIDPRSG